MVGGLGGLDSVSEVSSNMKENKREGGRKGDVVKKRKKNERLKMI